MVNLWKRSMSITLVCVYKHETRIVHAHVSRCTFLRTGIARDDVTRASTRALTRHERWRHRRDQDSGSYRRRPADRRYCRLESRSYTQTQLLITILHTSTTLDHDPTHKHNFGSRSQITTKRWITILHNNATFSNLLSERGCDGVAKQH